MKTFTSIAAGTCAAALLLAWSPIADNLRFAPEVGSAASKTFTSNMTLELDDLSVLVDGENVLEMFGVPEFSMTAESSIAVVDEYAGIGTGRPTKLSRLYEALSTKSTVDVSMAGEGESQSDETGSELAGKRVVFSWDEGAGVYNVAWAPDHSGEAELLDGLEEDMDLRGLLPAGEVAEGDTWEIPTDALKAMWMPGGDLAWEMDAEVDAEMEGAMREAMTSLFGDAFGDNLTGTRTATFKGTRDVDGTKVGVIAVELDLEINLDLAEMIQKLLRENGEMPEEVDLQMSVASMAAAITMEGELLWNMSQGLVHAMTLEGDFTASVEVEASVEAMGESTDFSASAEISGTQSMKVAAEKQ